MKLASIRLVTGNVGGLVGFYSALTGARAEQHNPEFAELDLDGAILAISGEQLVKTFNAGAAVPASNRSAIIELEVDDVDAVQRRLGAATTVAMPPSDMPWGNRSMLLRDPDGNLINIFARPRRRA